MIDRVFQSFDYEAAIMGLGGGDADPNPEMNVWLSEWQHPPVAHE